MGDETDDLVQRGCDAAERGDLDTAAGLFGEAVARGAGWAALNLGNVLVEQRRWVEADRIRVKVVTKSRVRWGWVAFGSC